MAARYLISGGTGYWNSTTNWSATSGGASGASFPIAGDYVIIDSASANADINVNVASACATLTVANTHTGTLTFTNTLTVSSTCTLGTGMTIAGAGALALTGTLTFTSAGKTIPTLALSGTVATVTTLADNVTCNTLSVQNSASGTANTVNGNKITINNNLTVLTAGNRSCTGTTLFEMVGTGIFQMGGGTSSITNPVTIKSTANVTLNTIATGGIGLGTGCVFTIEDGATVSMFANSLFRINGTSATLNGIDNLMIEEMRCWNTTNPTITTDSKLTAKKLWIHTSVTFAGTDGTFEVDDFIMAQANVTAVFTLTLIAGKNYKINNSIETRNGSYYGPSVIQSDSAGVKANLEMGVGYTPRLSNIKFTDIDASAGETIWIYDGTISNCTNVMQLNHKQPTIASTF